MYFTNIKNIFNINSKLLKLLLISHLDYRQIEKEIIKDIKKLSFAKDIYFIKCTKINNIHKNFFSLFMISLMNYLKIPKSEIIKYGKFIYYTRGTITATDNIIDKENKGVVFLKGITEHTTNNTLLILIFNTKLTELINSYDTCGNINNLFLEKIHSIAKSEGLRDRNLYEKYPKTSYITEKIHSGIGGELLKIGLLPFFEQHQEKKVEILEKALYGLGMSLQALDDLCDIKQDIDNGKINLAVAFYMENLNKSEEECKNIKIEKNSATKKYLENTINYSINAFESLEKIGYPINKQDGINLLKTLFKLRGLEKLWKITEEK